MSVVWVPIDTGSVVRAIPEMTAALLEQNLRGVREWDDYYADAATDAANRLEASRDGVTTEAVQFHNDERAIVKKVLDGMLAGPHESPTMLAILEAL